MPLAVPQTSFVASFSHGHQIRVPRTHVSSLRLFSSNLSTSSVMSFFLQSRPKRPDFKLMSEMSASCQIFQNWKCEFMMLSFSLQSKPKCPVTRQCPKSPPLQGYKVLPTTTPCPSFPPFHAKLKASCWYLNHAFCTLKDCSGLSHDVAGSAIATTLYHHTHIYIATLLDRSSINSVLHSHHHYTWDMTFFLSVEVNPYLWLVMGAICDWGLYRKWHYVRLRSPFFPDAVHESLEIQVACLKSARVLSKPNTGDNNVLFPFQYLKKPDDKVPCLAFTPLLYK
jgi:hypothetical protein